MGSPFEEMEGIKSENRRTKRRILIAVTGSVAAIKLEQPLNEFDREEFELKIIATEKALHFIRSQDFKSEIKILSDADEWQWSKRGDPVLHIQLRDWADLCLVAPLSANSLAKAANGICDNLVLCVLRAWDFSKPVVIAPAMNTAMWALEGEKENTLRKRRVFYNMTV